MQPFSHPAKWRDTVDPFSLHYHTFKPLEILGYPAARNDVFHVRGSYNGEEITAYIKAARAKDANIENEIALLRQLPLEHIPRVLDDGANPVSFSVTSAMPGHRLSVLVGANEHDAALEYMEAYGEALARIHQLTPAAGKTPDRKFRHTPPDALLEKLCLTSYAKYFSCPPAKGEQVFCHGDFHYANILWQDKQISGILDFELSGYGDRDFDIAWAIFRRHGQTFMKTEAEMQHFLRGYAKHGVYCLDSVIFYMAQNYVYFMDAADGDEDYCNYARSWLKRLD